MTLRAGAALTAPIALIAALTLGTGHAVSRASGAATPYTAAQAAAGNKAYQANCSRCHGANLEGVSAPALKGAASGIKGDTLSEAYSFISVQMPAGAPGSLTPTEYVNIVSFILSKDGVHAGSTKLTVASAKANKTVKL